MAAPSTRDQIIEATCELLENQGYHATGLSEIVRQSGAPKGSLYYYFPDGKDEITSEAVLFAGRRVAERIRQQLQTVADPGEAIQSFIEGLAGHIEESGFHAGGPLTIVAAETATTNGRLNQTCCIAYDMLKQVFVDKLLSGGFSAVDAERLAMMVLLTIEGGITVSRTYHDGSALRVAAQQMACILRNEANPDITTSQITPAQP
jgi:TetR/AcrR family transcriptional regulator, lmrAB and yxaGH operons repressor